MAGLYIRGAELHWERVGPDSYVRDIPAIASLEALEFTGPVTVFAGENGSGKSTLLEALAIAAGFNPEGGTRNYRFSTHDSHSDLYRAVRLIRSPSREMWGYFLRAESFYNVATAEEDYARPGYSEGLHRQSHGESFLSVVRRHIMPNGLYFLDEPEAAVSPQMQLTLLAEIYDCARRGAQFFIATHSPILLAVPGARILSFDSGAVTPCEYEDTGAYRIMKLFVTDRESILRRLLDRE